jgi:hypothetical protein
VKSIWLNWVNFWFRPISPASIGVYRILIALFLLQTFIFQIGGDFLSWFGKDSFISIENLKHTFWQDRPRLDIMLLFYQQDWAMKAYFYSLIAASLCLLIGFATRFSAGYLCLGLISMQNHCAAYANGGDNLMHFATLFLTFSAAGNYLAVDQIIQTKKNQDNETIGMATWALRMMQLQLAVVYANSFFSKMISPTWYDGSAVYYTMHYEELYHLPAFGIFDNILICRILGWLTLLIEGSMCSLVWIPRFRYYVLGAAALLHLGMNFALNLPVFEFVFIASLIVFVPGEVTDGIVGKFAKILRTPFLKSI